MYSNGHTNSPAFGSDRDFDAATDSQLNLGVTGLSARSLLASTTSVDTHQAKFRFYPSRWTLLDEERKALSHPLINRIHDF